MSAEEIFGFVILLILIAIPFLFGIALIIWGILVLWKPPFMKRIKQRKMDQLENSFGPAFMPPQWFIQFLEKLEPIGAIIIIVFGISIIGYCTLLFIAS